MFCLRYILYSCLLKKEYLNKLQWAVLLFWEVRYTSDGTHASNCELRMVDFIIQGSYVLSLKIELLLSFSSILVLSPSLCSSE